MPSWPPVWHGNRLGRWRPSLHRTGISQVPAPASRQRTHSNSPAPLEPPPGLPDSVDQKLADDLFAEAIEAALKPSPLADAKADDDAMQKLLKEHIRRRCVSFDCDYKFFKPVPKAGRSTTLIESVLRVYESESALSKTPADRVAAAMRQFTYCQSHHGRQQTSVRCRTSRAAGSRTEPVLPHRCTDEGRLRALNVQHQYGGRLSHQALHSSQNAKNWASRLFRDACDHLRLSF